MNTVSKDFEFDKGAVSKALLKEAGAQIETEAKQQNRSALLRPGEFVATLGGNLEGVHSILHTTLKLFDDSQAEILLQACPIIL